MHIVAWRRLRKATIEMTVASKFTRLNAFQDAKPNLRHLWQEEYVAPIFQIKNLACVAYKQWKLWFPSRLNGEYGRN